MYDGQWGMTRCTCAVDWKDVIDVGGNRIRRCCPNYPTYGSAFCKSCKENLVTTKRPSELGANARLGYLKELQDLKYLKQDEYFVEAILDFKEGKKGEEYKVK